MGCVRRLALTVDRGRAVRLVASVAVREGPEPVFARCTTATPSIICGIKLTQISDKIARQLPSGVISANTATMKFYGDVIRNSGVCNGA